MVILFYLTGCNVGEKVTYADGHIEEVVDTRNMCQVKDMDEWRGSGRQSLERAFVIVRQVEADEQQAYDIDDGNTPECDGVNYTIEFLFLLDYPIVAHKKPRYQQSPHRGPTTVLGVQPS